MMFRYEVAQAVGGFIAVGVLERDGEAVQRFAESDPRECGAIMVTAKADTPDAALEAARGREPQGWAQAHREGLA